MPWLNPCFPASFAGFPFKRSSPKEATDVTAAFPKVLPTSDETTFFTPGTTNLFNTENIRERNPPTPLPKTGIYN